MHSQLLEVFMSDAAQATPSATPANPSLARNWEWFWRFLAFVLLLATAWVVWVAVQMNPDPLVTPAAFDAASHAAAHNVQGKISPAVALDAGSQLAASPTAADRDSNLRATGEAAPFPVGEVGTSGASSAVYGPKATALSSALLPAELPVTVVAARDSGSPLPYPPVDLNRLKRSETLATVTPGKPVKANPPGLAE
jgi:hypothetical protein